MKKKSSREDNDSRPEVKKDPRFLLIVLAILALLEGGGIVYFYAESRNKDLLNITLQGKLDKSEISIREKSTELERQQSALQMLKEELDGISTEKARLEKGISTKERVLAEMEKQLKEKLEDEKSKVARIERQSQIAAYLRKRLKESKSTELQLMERLENLLKLKAELESRVVKLQGTPVGLGPGLAGIPLKGVTVAGRSPGGGSIEGQVLIANNKYGFVILNMGSHDGLSVGDEGTIVKDGTGVATAKVKKLYNKMSLADLISSPNGGTIEKNLSVTFTRPAGEMGL